MHPLSISENILLLVSGLGVVQGFLLSTGTVWKKLTILSVGFETGFNSKTTFNTVFKKFTGLTPTVFRDQHTREAAML